MQSAILDGILDVPTASSAILCTSQGNIKSKPFDEVKQLGVDTGQSFDRMKIDLWGWLILTLQHAEIPGGFGRALGLLLVLTCHASPDSKETCSPEGLGGVDQGFWFSPLAFRCRRYRGARVVGGYSFRGWFKGKPKGNST